MTSKKERVAKAAAAYRTSTGKQSHSLSDVLLFVIENQGFDGEAIRKMGGDLNEALQTNEMLTVRYERLREHHEALLTSLTGRGEFLAGREKQVIAMAKARAGL
jgi:hypothetical protein